MDRYTAQGGLGKERVRNSYGVEFRYDPLASRRHNSGTCSTGNTDLGEWSRYDMRTIVRLHYADKFLALPESSVEDEVRIILRLSDPPRVRYYSFQPSEHLRSKPDSSGSSVTVPSAESFPSEAVVVPWNVQCDLDKYENLRLFSASAKGKFYFFCPISKGTDSSTVINLYTYSSDSGLTQGPRRIQASLDDTGGDETYMHLVSGSAQDTDPAYAILTISSSRRVVIDLRAANGSLQDWDEFQQPPRVTKAPELEPECRTKGSTTKLIVATGHRDGNLLFVLVKSDSLAVSSNTTWSIVSTVPYNYVLSSRYLDTDSPDGIVNNCRVKDDGTFTMWGVGLFMFRYDPHEPVRSNTGTCNAGYSRFGEWSRRDILLEDAPSGLSAEMQSYIVQPGEEPLVGTINAKSDRTYSWAIAFNYEWRNVYPPKIKLMRFQETDAVIDLRAINYNLELIMEHSRRIVMHVVHGDGLIYTLHQPVRNESDWSTVGMARNWTLAHFPFNPEQIVSGVLPAITSVPWKVNCDFRYDYLTAIAKGKLYFLCSVYDAPLNRTLSNLYIHDSTTTQSSTQPAIQAKYDFPTSIFKQLTIIEDGAEPHPKYAILRWDGDRTQDVGLMIDLQQGSQVPPMWLGVYNLPGTNGVEPSCHAKLSSSKLIIASAVSGVALVMMVIFTVVSRRRKHGSRKVSDKGGATASRGSKIEQSSALSYATDSMG
ncbi:hypothetical protein BGZ94_007349 [Podila epigama]|nr:hypothetical protein BGZ94_007349 [Podila epigama]